MAKTCSVCGTMTSERDRLVLISVRVIEVHCSQPCFEANVRKRQLARRAAQRRWGILLLLVGVSLGGAALLQQRLQKQEVKAIISPAPAIVKQDAPTGPTPFGPAWPPTDEEWIAQFEKASWVYPLPGPVRRAPVVDARLCGALVSKKQPPARCRTEGRCGVDLGGELWGEHVYAAHDGVVDHVERTAHGGRGGLSVRLSHWGGMVFTQYFHLAAIPRRIVPGAPIAAGEIIGLLGDTGLAGLRHHLHFTLSVRPSSQLPEVYWDPSPWMAQWPLRVPTRGTVAGLVSLDSPVEPDAALPTALRRQGAQR